MLFTWKMENDMLFSVGSSLPFTGQMMTLSIGVVAQSWTKKKTYCMQMKLWRRFCEGTREVCTHECLNTVYSNPNTTALISWSTDNTVEQPNILKEHLSLEQAKVIFLGYRRSKPSPSLILFHCRPNVHFYTALRYEPRKIKTHRNIHKQQIRHKECQQEIYTVKTDLNSQGKLNLHAKQPTGTTTGHQSWLKKGLKGVIYQWALKALCVPPGASCKASSALWHCQTSWNDSSHYCRTTLVTVSSRTWERHKNCTLHSITMLCHVILSLIVIQTNCCQSSLESN